MHKILAISRLTVHNAIHSRVFVSLLAMVLLVVIGLPLTVKSDGTLVGHFRIMVEYTLGLVSALLSLTTIWTACGAISVELANRRLHLVLTKPVSRGQIWVGKWLGVIAINGLCLAIAALVIYAMLRWTLRPGPLSAEDRRILNAEVLAAHRTIQPLATAVDEAVARHIREMHARNLIPDTVTDAQVARALQKTFQRAAGTIVPGADKEFVFRLPADHVPGQALTLRYRMTSSRPERTPVRCRWHADSAAGGAFDQTIAAEPDRTGRLTIPAAVAAGVSRLRIVFTNLQTDPPATVIFEPNAGLLLTEPAGRFETNYLRSLALIFLNLMLLAAIGLTAGAIFSLPTAAFAASFLMVVLAAGSYLASIAASGAWIQPNGAAAAMYAYPAGVQLVCRVLSGLTDPLRAFTPIAHLASGEALGMALVGRALLIYVVLYSGCTAAVGIAGFRQRQIALWS